MEEIEIAVCDFLGVSLLQIRSRTRKMDIVKARFLCWYFIYKNLGWTFEKIGKEYSYDHSNVSHGVKSIELSYELYEDDKKLVRDIWVKIKYKGDKTIKNTRYRELVSDMIKYDHLTFCKLMTSYKDRAWIYEDLQVPSSITRKIEEKMKQKEEKEKDQINKTKSNDLGGKSKSEQIKPQIENENIPRVRR